MRNTFESLLVRSLRHYFDASHIPAFCERRPQTRYRKQFVDIVVDSPAVGYLAIECKSIGNKYLGFSSHFNNVEDGLNHTHQIQTIGYYLNKTGRTGYLAVEIRTRLRGIGNRCYLMPWEDVLSRFEAKKQKGYSDKEIRRYPEAVKDKSAPAREQRLYDVSNFF